MVDNKDSKFLIWHEMTTDGKRTGTTVAFYSSDNMIHYGVCPPSQVCVRNTSYVGRCVTQPSGKSSYTETRKAVFVEKKKYQKQFSKLWRWKIAVGRAEFASEVYLGNKPRRVEVSNKLNIFYDSVPVTRLKTELKSRFPALPDNIINRLQSTEDLPDVADVSTGQEAWV